MSGMHGPPLQHTEIAAQLRREIKEYIARGVREPAAIWSVAVDHGIRGERLYWFLERHPAVASPRPREVGDRRSEDAA